MKVYEIVKRTMNVESCGKSIDMDEELFETAVIKFTDKSKCIYLCKLIAWLHKKKLSKDLPEPIKCGYAYYIKTIPAEVIVHNGLKAIIDCKENPILLLWFH